MRESIMTLVLNLAGVAIDTIMAITKLLGRFLGYDLNDLTPNQRTSHA